MPELHPGQVAAYRMPGRFKAVCCGRRYGKTALASTVICDGAARGESWGLFAPDYKITSETYRDIYEILEPITLGASKIDGVIRCIGGGRVDFWTLNNPRAGRSRKYHGVVLDEVAFAGPDMRDIWEKSIKPALLDYRGVGWALSTPAGVDDQNWFYLICNDLSLGFVKYHAPSADNPYLPAEELAKLEADNSPEVYRQEYLAEFVDWSGAAFFAMESLLIDGKPIGVPDKTDVVFLTIDTAIKAGQEHNSTGYVVWSYNMLVTEAPLTILDWGLIQIEGAAQETWLQTTFVVGEEWARKTGARQGFLGAFIEDKATGTVLLQQGRRLGWPVAPIDSKLTAMGKEERAIAASPFVFKGDVKIAEPAFNKTTIHKQQSANHFIRQVVGFRFGNKDVDGKDLLDCFCYGVSLARGAGGGLRKGM